MTGDEGMGGVAGEDLSLGATIRQLRLNRRMTLEALARASSLTAAMISKIETGAGNPSINSLRQIAKALNVPTALFFAQEAVEQAAPVSFDNKRVYAYPHAKVTYTAIVSPVTEEVKFVMIEAGPGAEGGVDAICHEGFEQGMVIDGELEVTVGDQVYLLGPGNTLSFPSTIPHRWVNRGDVPSRSVWAIAVNHELGSFADPTAPGVGVRTSHVPDQRHRAPTRAGVHADAPEGADR